MGDVYPFKGPPPASMTRLEKFIFNNNDINIYLSMIILYLSLSESSIWNSHVTISVALNSGKVKSILTSRLVLGLPSFVCHCITAYVLVLSFIIILLINTAEKNPPSNNTWKLVHFSFPRSVFIHPCIIGE